MPSESQAQHRAMEAAEHGHSTLGIPAKVGAEYDKADKAVNVKRLPQHVAPVKKAKRVRRKP